jgi:hypothetical protein
MLQTVFPDCRSLQKADNHNQSNRLLDISDLSIVPGQLCASTLTMRICLIDNYSHQLGDA